MFLNKIYSTSHFLKDNAENFLLIGAFKDVRVFGNRIKRKAVDMFETNIMIKALENLTAYLSQLKKNNGDFNFMILFTIGFFFTVAGKISGHFVNLIIF